MSRARYTFIGTLASGGMGTVFLARMAGSAGFSRLVAVKRLLPELAAQRDFITMLVDEARLASQIRHVNVIDTLDLVASDGAFSVVLEYVEGAALSSLISSAKRASTPIPREITLGVMHGVLRGLDAAHETRGPEGHALGIVHRDVSPQNVLVGVDGIPRIIDFGIAKAMGRMTATRPGEVRGKFAYMAPEQLLERPVTRQADVYAAGVMLWEMLTGQRLFKLGDERAVIAAVLRGEIRPPSEVNPDVPPELDAIVLKATAHELSDRYLTARDFLEALASCSSESASDEDIGSWVRELAAPQLSKIYELLQNVAPEASRSVDDLLRELAQTATPHGGFPAAPPESSGTPVQDRTPPSAHGITSSSMELASALVPQPSSNRTWVFLTMASALAMAGLLLGVLGLRQRTIRNGAAPPPTASFIVSQPALSGVLDPPASPSESSIPVSPPSSTSTVAEIEPTPLATEGSRATAVPTRDADRGPRAPSSSASAAKKPGHPKRTSAPTPDKDFDHR